MILPTRLNSFLGDDWWDFSRQTYFSPTRYLSEKCLEMEKAERIPLVTFTAESQQLLCRQHRTSMEARSLSLIEKSLDVMVIPAIHNLHASKKAALADAEPGLLP